LQRGAGCHGFPRQPAFPPALSAKSGTPFSQDKLIDDGQQIMRADRQKASLFAAPAWHILSIMDCAHPSNFKELWIRLLDAYRAALRSLSK
jgi:hypothetical protein